MNTIDALRALYVALGGSAETAAGFDTVAAAIGGIAEVVPAALSPKTATQEAPAAKEPTAKKATTKKSK